MKLRHALMMVLMVVTVAGLAHAVSPDPSMTTAPAAAVVAAAPATADAATDPYLNASEITSEAGKVARTCLSFSYQCQYDGGPCSPVAGACICGTANGSLVCGSTH